jgi:hypothetical protein
MEARARHDSMLTPRFSDPRAGWAHDFWKAA